MEEIALTFACCLALMFAHHVMAAATTKLTSDKVKAAHEAFENELSSLINLWKIEIAELNRAREGAQFAQQQERAAIVEELRVSKLDCAEMALRVQAMRKELQEKRR